MILQGTRSYLRAIEPSDLEFLYRLENDTNVWEISNTITPYSKSVLGRYLDNSYRDIYDVKQLRLCICTLKDEVVGLVDLFDFDPKNKRVGLGLIIASQDKRNQGLGTEVVNLCCNYVFNMLDVHQVHANILEENQASIHLFEKVGFERVGIKKDWVRYNGTFKNEILYQKIKS